MRPQDVDNTSVPVDGLFANPQMATLAAPQTNKENDSSSMVTSKLRYTDTPNWFELIGEPVFKFGIVISQSTTQDRHIYAMSKPASFCQVRTVVVLTPPEEGENPDCMDDWLDRNSLGRHKQDVNIAWGEQGFQNLLQDSSIDAVYIIVPPG